MKLICLSGVSALLLMCACNQQPAAEQTTTVVAPVETVKVAAPVKVVEPEKSTTVTLDPKGATVKTKNVNIEVKK